MTREELEQLGRKALAMGDRETGQLVARKLRDLRTREEIAEGQTLQIGPFDTGIELPQSVFEGLAGAGRRLSQIGTLGTHETPEEAARLLDQSTPATVGGIAADLASMYGVGTGLKAAGVVGGTVGNLLTQAGRAVQAPTSVARAAPAAGLYGAATNEDRLASGGAGALGGALGVAAPRAIGSVIKPGLQAGARTLADRGVRMTPGQLLGGVAQRTEDTLTSVPFLGSAINRAKERSLSDFNKAAIDDALSLVGKALPKNMKAGREAVSWADDAISDMYDPILDRMPVSFDTELEAGMGTLTRVLQELPEQNRKWVERNVLDQISKTFRGGGTATGRQFKLLTRHLRETYKKALRSSDPFVEEAGKVVRALHQTVMEAAKRQNPQLASDLAQVDSAYSAISRVVETAEKSTAKNALEGVFTPNALRQSVRGAARRAGRGRDYARGRAYGQELADAGSSVLPSTVNDSGTAGRVMAGLGLLGLGAAPFAADSPNPLMFLPAAALGGAYMTPALRQAILARPPGSGVVRAGFERAAPYVGLLGASANINR